MPANGRMRPIVAGINARRVEIGGLDPDYPGETRVGELLDET